MVVGGGGESRENESHEGEGRKTPLNVCDLLIAVIVAIPISIAARRRR